MDPTSAEGPERQEPPSSGPGRGAGDSASRAGAPRDPTSGEEMSHEPSKVVDATGDSEPAPPAEERPPG